MTEQDIIEQIKKALDLVRAKNIEMLKVNGKTPFWAGYNDAILDIKSHLIRLGVLR